jgi:hypothetical protein
MDEENGAQLHLVAHDSAVHAALLMDLLRIVQRIDPVAFKHYVEQAARELHDAVADPNSPLKGPSPRSVLDHRLAYLRSVQIQASVGYPRDLESDPAAGALS